jgi:hypothetical protein
MMVPNYMKERICLHLDVILSGNIFHRQNDNNGTKLLSAAKKIM